MAFPRRRPPSEIPQVNLVPMMDVLMTVLTFFIIISMTLTGESVNVFLPQVAQEQTGEEEQPSGATLVVGLNEQKEILLSNQAVSPSDLIQRIQTFLQANPDGTVILKADRTLPYRDVASLLKTMRDVGGGRVSLSIELD